jgi:dipeptidase E
MTGSIYLYSDQEVLGNTRIDRLWLDGLTGREIRIGYIPSASDSTRRYFDRKREYYAQYGIRDFVYFDLNKEHRPELLPELLACQAIHLSGGDPFQFNDAIRKRGFGSVLRKYHEGGGILLGISAGGIVLTPSIEISHLFYRSRTKKPEAAGLLSFHFLPHFNRRVASLEQLKEFSARLGCTVYAVGDGDGIEVKGELVTTVGAVLAISKGCPGESRQ